MADLTLGLSGLPPPVIADVLDVLTLHYSGGGEPVAGVVLFRSEGGNAVGEITVKDDETTLTATVTALDAEGHETTFDEMPTWESSDDSVLTCQPSEDGYSATFIVGAPGSAIVTVTGVETGSGERVEVKSTGLVNVTAGDAVVGSVEFETGSQGGP